MKNSRPATVLELQAVILHLTAFEFGDRPTSTLRTALARAALDLKVLYVR